MRYPCTQLPTALATSTMSNRTSISRTKCKPMQRERFVLKIPSTDALNRAQQMCHVLYAQITINAKIQNFHPEKYSCVQVCMLMCDHLRVLSRYICTCMFDVTNWRRHRHPNNPAEHSKPSFCSHTISLVTTNK
jgi:hypothetical protein